MALRALLLRARQYVDVSRGALPEGVEAADVAPRATGIKFTGTTTVPVPPDSGTLVLTSTAGVLSWEEPAA